MADGRVQRIDEQSRSVHIVRRGRVYAAPLTEVEPKARVPGARVSFEMVRRGGEESAANVTLRSGTRTNRRQRRFGDLTGAKRPGSKVNTAVADEYGIDVATQPFRVVGAWAEAMAIHDYDGATGLYHPDAMIHTASGSVMGRNHIRAFLETSELGGLSHSSIDMSGLDRCVRLEARARNADHTVYFEVDTGAVIEQWTDLEPDLSPSEEPSFTLAVVKRGEVPDEAVEYAEARIAELVARSGHDARFGRVKLSAVAHARGPRSALVEATVDFDTSKYALPLIRAHADGSTFAEATDLVVDRLASRIEHQRDWQRHRPAGREAVPGGWRHGNLARSVRSHYERPRAERELVRHKSFAPDEVTVDEAAWDMALLDYDFFLFVEAETGDDCFLERGDDATLRLQCRQVDTETIDLGVNDVSAMSGNARPMSVGGAIDLLDQTNDPFVFFVNTTSGRGNVVYRRLDGHYGLITPPV